MQLKKFALYLTGLLLLAVFDLSAAQAEKFIPSSSPMVIRLDANRLLKMPIRNMLDKKNPAIQKFITQWEQIEKSAAANGIDLQKLFADNIWIAQTGQTTQESGAYFNTLIPEQQLSAALQKEGFSPQDIDGRKVYMRQDTAITYLTGDVILFVRNNNNLPLVLTASLQSSGNMLTKSLDCTGLLAAVCDVSKVKQAAQAAKANSKVQYFTARVDLTGKEPMALDIDTVITFRKAKDAMKSGMQIQLAVPGIVGMLLSNDDKLMTAVLENFKVMPQDKNLQISFDLSGQLIRRLIKYFENPANRPRIPAAPAAQSNN